MPAARGTERPAESVSGPWGQWVVGAGEKGAPLWPGWATPHDLCPASCSSPEPQRPEDLGGEGEGGREGQLRETPNPGRRGP